MTFSGFFYDYFESYIKITKLIMLKTLCREGSVSVIGVILPYGNK